MKLVFEAFD